MHAKVQREQGRGALLGLALGALRGGDHDSLAATIALARVLRDHGEHRAAPLAARYRAGQSPARVTPIALLHASMREVRMALIVADAAVVGDPPAWVVTAALAAGAIAAAAWEGLDPRAMAAAGLDDVDDACAALGDAAAGLRRDVYDDVRAADEGRPLPEELPADRRIVRVAIGHLLAGTAYVDAIEDAVGHGAATLTGALVGASLGEAALPADAIAALLDGVEGARWRAYAAFGGDPPPPGPV